MRELLQDIRDEIRSLVAGKADKSEVAALATRVDTAEGHISGLLTAEEHRQRTREETTERRNWLWPTVAGVLAVVATVATIIPTLH